MVESLRCRVLHRPFEPAGVTRHVGTGGEYARIRPMRHRPVQMCSVAVLLAACLTNLVSAQDPQKPSDPSRSEGEKSSPKVGVDTLPSCFYTPSPPYTGAARAAKFEGKVSVQGIITTDGRITNLRFVKWTGLDPSKSVYGLDEWIMSTMKTWKCKPALRDGKPIAIQVPFELTFHRW